MTAYSEIVDYCMGARKDFSVGGLHYSEEGKAYFADCRVLFILDLAVFAVSAIILVVWLIIRNKLPVKCERPKNHGAGYRGALILLISGAILGGFGSINFDTTFVIFHSIFFPGKSNWIFDPEIDEIINILPETFFMRCAILIIVLIVFQSLLFIFADLIINKHKQKTTIKE